ncbi:MAG: 50S ribosomal protein L25, partial [Planctomycetes bacterium]|nr:50S ribosomal protein L25 [Planctomycetota bacterium]
MSSSTPSLKAEPRTGSGTRDSFSLRKAGRMPINLVGHGEETASFHIDDHSFQAALRHHERVFMLEHGDKREQVMLHDVQWDRMGDRILHIEFLRVPVGEVVEVQVVLEFVGHPKGAAKGEFVKPLLDIAVKCVPRSIPESIALDVSELDLDEQILAGDLTMPEGVELLQDPEEVVCAIRLSQEEVEPEEGAEGDGSAEPEV